MGRLSRVQDEEVFAAVGVQLAEHGHTTLQTVVEATGVSVGSLYHRYGSREGLLARAWLDSVKTFQASFLTALNSAADDAGEQTALATPRFCRSEPERAIILSCCRQSEFLGPETPADLREEIGHINDAGFKALKDYARRTGYGLQACQLGIIAFPMGAVSQYLPRHTVPVSVDRYVSLAFHAAVGNTPASNV